MRSFQGFFNFQSSVVARPGARLLTQRIAESSDRSFSLRPSIFYDSPAGSLGPSLLLGMVTYRTSQIYSPGSVLE